MNPNEKLKRLNTAKSIIDNLFFLRRSLTLYPPEHPQIITGLDGLKSNLDRYFSLEKHISFNIYEQDMFLENEPMEADNPALRKFTDACCDIGIDSFTITKGVSNHELINFLQLLKLPAEVWHNNGDIIQKLRKKNVIHIAVNKLRVCTDLSTTLPPDAKKNITAVKKSNLFDLALTKLDAIFKNIPIDNIVNLNEAEALVNSLIEGILENNQTLTALTSLKKFNNYTCRHSINVTILSLLLAIELGLTDNELLTIGTGALLHDIGKLKIPIEIIDKKSSLTSAEWALVKNHPIKGFDIICDLPGLDRMIPVIAYEHHLGFDLSGYPATKRIEKPHLFSRLVQIADAYDGATAHRSYHNAASPSIVLASMYKKSGSLFDPTLLRLFIKTIGLYPIGSLVRLSNGQVGIVAETNTDDISCPRVKIIADQGGLKSSDYLLDTVNGNHSKGPSILGFADPEIYKINDDYSLLKVI